MKRYTMTPHLWFLTALGLVGVTLLNLQFWVTSWHNWLGLSGGFMFGWALGSLLAIWQRGRVRVIDALRARESRELERRPYQQLGVWWHMGRKDKTGQVIELPRPAPELEKRYPLRAPLFLIGPAGAFITCLVCGMTSYNRHDVEERYCANCHRFFGTWQDENLSS
jgi:hypothetical protein